MSEIKVDDLDLLKVRDAVELARDFFEHRDRMNNAIHKGKEVRFSPITSEVMAASDRLKSIFGDYEKIEFLKNGLTRVAKEQPIVDGKP